MVKKDSNGSHWLREAEIPELVKKGSSGSNWLRKAVLASTG
jgi:hypothetical protein